MPTLLGIPEQIARYKLLSELGRGSMGQVYLALDPNIDRKVAIKIFLPLLKVGVAEQWELRQRFIFEARAAGQLNHPGIVTIFDADTDPDTGLSYLAMEWVNGPSLDDLIRESGPLSIDRSMTIVEEVAVALDVAHRQGLVHRDIKPANILLENNGRAKVTDFGIAKLASMSITTTGWIPGSPFYMSPEQIRNEGIDRRSDLYALGAVLYQCLTGALPFEAESLAALTHMILEIDPRPVRSLNPAVSAELAAVIDMALAKSPDDRFDSGREFARALQLARAGKFRPAPMGRTTSGVERSASQLEVAELAADGGTGTIGLVAGPPEVHEFPQTDGSARDDDPASQEEQPVVPAPILPEVAGPPASPTLQPAGRVRRLALVAAVVVALVVVWSLRPVESEPTTSSSTIARLFSAAPRFDVDAPPSGGELELLTEPELGLESEEPNSQLPVVASGPPPAPTTHRGAVVTPAANRSQPLAVEPAYEADAEPSPTGPSSVPPAAPTVRATSALELVYRNRLKNASLSVSIDGKQVYAGNVATPQGFFNRTVGKNVWTSVDLTPGEHVVDVRVTGAEGKVDLVRQATATFEDGQTHRLRVVVTPLKKLKLSWKESPAG
jgi:serine/threonine protein kinase